MSTDTRRQLPGRAAALATIARSTPSPATPRPARRKTGPREQSVSCPEVRAGIAAQPGRDPASIACDLRGVDVARPRYRNRELFADAAGMGRHQDDPIGKTNRLAHVMGHQQDGLAALLADALQ